MSYSINDNSTEHLSCAAVNWQVYIILCSDGSLYTGITTDMERRLRQHAGGKGAKYFRGREPLKVMYQEGDHTRSSASKREAEIKAMNRAEKSLLVAISAQQLKFQEQTPQL
jgi:putative endonuclease